MKLAANPHLIALLHRNTSAGDTQRPEGVVADHDDLGPAKGIMLAAVISAAIWAGLALVF
jgi:hypothetical protein